MSYFDSMNHNSILRTTSLINADPLNGTVAAMIINTASQFIATHFQNSVSKQADTHMVSWLHIISVIFPELLKTVPIPIRRRSFTFSCSI